MRKKVLAVLALMAAWGGAVLAQEEKSVRSEAVSGKAAPAPDDQGDLVKITKQRMPMDKRLLGLCIGPQAVVGPHTAAEVDVYVNATVIDYRSKNPDSFAYPVGSKFVKKKYPRIGAKTPDIATVMVKKADTGKVTDWEFSMVQLSDGKPLALRGHISCADCHERYKARGYISSESENALQEYLRSLKRAEKGGADQAATAAESKSESNEKPEPEKSDMKDGITKVMPPAGPHPAGTLLFAIFPFDGEEFDERTATAWEFVPDRAENPLVKRCVFRKSTWTARPISPDSPDLIRLQVNDGPRPYSVRLYHIDYATWDVRKLYSGKQVGEMGRAGNRAYIRTTEGPRIYDLSTGKVAETGVTRVLAAKEKNWLVQMNRKGRRVVALSDPKSGEVVREFKGFPWTLQDLRLDPTGRYAIIEGSYKNKAGRPINILPFGEPNAITRSFTLFDLETGTRKELSARAIGRGGSGRGILPSGPEYAFALGQLRFTNALAEVKPDAFRYRKDEEWVAIDLATQKEVARLPRSDWEPPAEPSPVPDYLKELCEKLPGAVYGRYHDLALAAMVHHGAVDAEVARKPGEIRFVFAVLSPEGDSLLTQQGENLHYFDFKARTHRKVPVPEGLRGGGDACAVRIP